MGFLDLFRPRWKHSDLEVRLEAIRSLENDERDRQILAEVARQDRDPKARRLALKKPEVVYRDTLEPGGSLLIRHVRTAVELEGPEATLS